MQPDRESDSTRALAARIPDVGRESIDVFNGFESEGHFQEEGLVPVDRFQDRPRIPIKRKIHLFGQVSIPVQFGPDQVGVPEAEAKLHTPRAAVTKRDRWAGSAFPSQELQIRIRPEDAQGRPKKGRRRSQLPGSPLGDSQNPLHQGCLEEGLTPMSEQVEANPIWRFHPGQAPAVESQVPFPHPEAEQNARRTGGLGGFQSFPGRSRGDTGG